MENEETLKSEAEQVKNAEFCRITAQTIRKHLIKFTTEKGRFETRWVWELLQNARDAAPNNRGVKVKLYVTPQKLVFLHDGAPFSNKEIFHLIYHGSTKEDKPEQSGKFGSGFLSTHLLSKKVHVRGKLKNGYYFNFLLNREGNSTPELEQHLGESWDQYMQSWSENSGLSEFTTEYVYPISSEAEAIVKKGIEALHSHITYALAFNEALAEICIQHDGELISIKKGQPQEVYNNIVILPIKWEPEDGHPKGVNIALTREDNLCVAVKLTRSNGQLTVELDDSTPRIFEAFPLTGTEDFGFPAIVQSIDFYPNEERNGVPLGIGEENDKINIRNQALVLRACDLLARLIETAISEGWLKAHRMAFIPTFVAKDKWLDKEWYKNEVGTKLVHGLRNSNILVNVSKGNIQPINSWIPVSPSASVSATDLWDLVVSIRNAHEKLPQRGDATDWAKNLDSWKPFIGDESPDIVEEYTIRKLAQHISSFENLEQLKTEHIDIKDPLLWLESLYDLIGRTNESSLFSDMEFVPDQIGNLKKRRDLSIDDNIDEKLKTIADDIGCKIRSTLLHKKITCQNLCLEMPAKTESEVLSKAIAEIKEQSKDGSADETFRQANVSLFWWIVKHQQLAMLDGFPALTQELNKEEHQVLTLEYHKPDEAETPLAPPACWPATAREFFDLFPRRFILSNEYFDACSDPELWRRVLEAGYIRINPVYVTSETIKTFIPDEPLPEADGDHHSTGPVEVTKIAFLTKSNCGVLDMVRSSKPKGINLLRFILSSVLELDKNAFKKVETDCSCEHPHHYYRAGWLIPIKKRDWVNLGTNQYDKPSTESLAKLLENRDDLDDLLRQDKSKFFMDAIGVSMADLLFRSIADDEDERYELASSMAQMVNASGNDPAKIHALANEIEDNPEMLDSIQERQERREQARRNQEIGAKVESLLRENLESKGFQVKRTGFGSDLKMKLPLDDEPSFHLEIEKDERSFLIEVKSTTGSSVRMSKLQAETSIDKGERFILCVVILATQEHEPSKSDVSEGARFITDISERLSTPWDGYAKLQGTRNKTQTRYGDIELEIEKTNVRFKIGEKTWASAFAFDEAIEFFSTAMRQ